MGLYDTGHQTLSRTEAKHNAFVMIKDKFPLKHSVEAVEIAGVLLISEIRPSKQVYSITMQEYLD